jgi:CheY-like chemotaxis protein
MLATKSQVSAQRHRALVVDDSQIARYILSRLLARHGFDVDVADSGEAALRHLGGPVPDVVFLDHLLPGMDGLMTLNRIRAQPQTARLPVVMYTSQDSREFAVKAVQAGANDVYSKTSDESRLVEILQRLELLPVEVSRRTAPAKVVSHGTHEATANPAKRNRGTITRASLAKLLEPSLEAHHARLHHELLGEFAILERYEERMRRDLFSRVDALTRHATERVDHAFIENRARNRRRHRRGAFGGFAIAATVLLGLALCLGAISNLAERAKRLESDGIRTLAALDAQSHSVDALSAMFLDARQMLGSGNTYPDFDTAPAVTYRNIYPAGNVADNLVSELQSMGILGPVRIETAAGSFCVTSTPDGFGIEASNLALAACQPLPLQLGSNGP